MYLALLWMQRSGNKHLLSEGEWNFKMQRHHPQWSLSLSHAYDLHFCKYSVFTILLHPFIYTKSWRGKSVSWVGLKTSEFYRIRSNWCFRCRPRKFLVESVNLYQWWSVSHLSEQWRMKTYMAGPWLKTGPYWPMFNIILGLWAAVLLPNISKKFDELAIYAGVCPSHVDWGFAL